MTIADYELTPYRHSDTLKYEEPTFSNKVSSKVIKELSNTYHNSILVDEKGWIWVKKAKLHSILRTTAPKANYITMAFKEEDKQYYNNELYLRGFMVIALLRKEQEEHGTGTKGVNLLASEQFYNAIDRCETVKLMRLEYDSQKKEDRKKLKGRRKRKYKIKLDELTGEPLMRNAEFSHIRSYSVYKHLSDEVDNGLLVNKQTHKLITERGINDEVELLAFCKEHGFSTDWYEPYIKKFCY